MSLECRARLLSGSDNSHKELNTNVRDAAVPRRSWNANGRAAAVPRQFVFLNRRQLHRSERQGVCGYRPCHVFGKTCFSKVATVIRIGARAALRISSLPRFRKIVFSKVATVTRIRATGALRISALPRFRKSVFLKSCNSHKEKRFRV